MQILAIVANIQVRFLNSEVDKGFLKRAFHQDLASPKRQIKHCSMKEMGGVGVKSCSCNFPQPFFKSTSPAVKGNPVNILEPKFGLTPILVVLRGGWETSFK